MAILTPGRYRILTLRQPWAWLVIHGPKNIENRTWPVSYRGPFLVHAGKEMLRREYTDVSHYARDRGVIIPPVSELQYGGIIGIATIDDILEPKLNTGLWSLPGQHGWVLSSRQPLQFIPCKGGQGFRYYEHEIAA